MEHTKLIKFYNLLKVKSLSRVQLFAIPSTVAYQTPPSMGFRILESGLPFPSRGSSRPKDQAQVSRDAGRHLPSEPPGNPSISFK